MLDYIPECRGFTFNGPIIFRLNPKWLIAPIQVTHNPYSGMELSYRSVKDIQRGFQYLKDCGIDLGSVAEDKESK